MKAAFLRAPYQVEIRDIDEPEPGHGEALLHVEMVGLCGSDIHLAERWAKDWVRFGHETVARAVAVGTGVSDLVPGDLVCVRTTTMCGLCRYCNSGRPSSCTGWRATRMSVGLAEYVVVPRRSIWKVQDLEVSAASLIEPLAVAVDVVDTADIQLGDRVGVVGPGPIGIMAIRLATLRGASRVIVMGTAADVPRFELCRELGADVCVNIDEEDPIEIVRDHTGGVGLDRIIVTAPPVAVPGAIALTRYGGILSFVGFSSDVAAAVVPIDLNAFHFSKLQLRASYASPCAPFPVANDILARNVMPVDRIITHVFPLDGLGTALRLVGDHADGVVKASIAMTPLPP